MIGIVGKTNVGKSTFFKALTLMDVEIGDRIFVTIKPNQGVGHVTRQCPCKKLGVKCNPRNSQCVSGIRLMPIKLLDVAGLVPGAHEGKGLGNRFLDDLRQADAFIQVVDMSGSTNENGEHVESGSYDPENEIEFLKHEMDEWFSGILKRNWDKIKKQVQHVGKNLEEELARQLSGLNISEDSVKQAIKNLDLSKDPVKWDETDLKLFSIEIRALSKRMIIAGNKVDMKTGEENYKRLEQEHDIMPCSAESELALKEAAKHDLIEYFPGDGGFKVRGELSDKQKKALEFIQKNVLEKFGSTGVQHCINSLVFDEMGMIVVYPVASISRHSDKQGNVLPDAFLVAQGTRLKEFAEKVHSTMAEHFIGGLNAERKKIGADYELKDGDVVEILFK
ncbi:MAG: redox-regulated ATPase YchF [Candidatus Aenigmarchaeota archaeon]|nr:redox-regulated ATPase YchF [Candidatus Aenigmarchaeota archaeon]